jgi:hypothetical protein
MTVPCRNTWRRLIFAASVSPVSPHAMQSALSLRARTIKVGFRDFVALLRATERAKILGRCAVGLERPRLEMVGTAPRIGPLDRAYVQSRITYLSHTFFSDNLASIS